MSPTTTNKQTNLPLGMKSQMWIPVTYAPHTDELYGYDIMGFKICFRNDGRGFQQHTHKYQKDLRLDSIKCNNVFNNKVNKIRH